MLIKLSKLMHLHRIVRDQRGISAVEFALVAPLMIMLYFGCVDVSDGVAVDRKVTLTAATLADLTAQVTTLSASDMSNILDASSAIIAPYNKQNMSMSVACVSFDSDKNMTVKWTVQRNGTPPTITVPAALQVADSQLVYAQVSYDYKPIIGSALFHEMNLSDHMFMSPRISAPNYAGTPCI